MAYHFEMDHIPPFNRRGFRLLSDGFRLVLVPFADQEFQVCVLVKFGSSRGLQKSLSGWWLMVVNDH